MKSIHSHIHFAIILSYILSVIFILGACQPKSDSPKGFSLPEGDIAKGKEAYLKLECHRCHRISGLNDLPSPAEGANINVTLGGEVYRVKTYGDLVTSIINPTHVVDPKYKEQYFFTDEKGKSIMPDANTQMTVSQMIDLVSFLQSRYKLTHPEYDYMSYGL